MFFVCNSYAKCNLFLSIKGILPDGYHTLETLMIYLSLADRITISQNYSQNINLSVSGKFQHKLTTDKNFLKNNIITKTFQIMNKKYDIPIGFDIQLEKNIPISSGLGGGSSNAATVINFCNDYFELKMSQQEKYEIAKIIGADVPFFTQNNVAICSGIGDIIQPIKVDKSICNYSVLIIDPMLKLNTKSVYSDYDNLKLTSKQKQQFNSINDRISLDINTLIRLGRNIDIMKMCAFGSNGLADLNNKICQFSKPIVNFVEKDSKSLLFSGITGAGSATIMVFANKSEAAYYLTQIQTKFPVYAIQTHFLSQVNNVAKCIGRFAKVA